MDQKMQAAEIFRVQGKEKIMQVILLWLEGSR